jgi:hypothetical protein
MANGSAPPEQSPRQHRREPYAPFWGALYTATAREIATMFDDVARIGCPAGGEDRQRGAEPRGEGCADRNKLCLEAHSTEFWWGQLDVSGMGPEELPAAF